MEIPKALILFPAIEDETPSTYGLIDFDISRAGFFDMLREHRKHAAELSRASASVPTQYGTGSWFSSPLYQQLTSKSGWCKFIRREPGTNFEDIFHGITDLDALLSLSATNVMHPQIDVDLALDNDDNMGRPVVIDLKAWHRDAHVGAIFRGDLGEFWTVLRSMCLPTNGYDEMIIKTPWRMPVTRLGPKMELGPFENGIEFLFTSNSRGFNTRLRTKPYSISEFVGPFEDAVGSIR